MSLQTPIRLRLAAVALAAVSVAWLDPWAKAREASRLYTAGKYDEAVTHYQEALTDQPDSTLLHFNLGDAAYRQGKFTDAVNAFQQVPTGDADPARAARVAYNTGNAKYRLGQAAEASDPKAALGLYAEAIASYRRALGAAPDSVEAKFNHEFVERKMAELEKKLEEQRKQQEQQQQQQQKEQQQQQEQQPGEQQRADQQPGEQKQSEQKGEEENDRKAEQPPEKPDAPPTSAGGRQEQPGQMTPQEATALLDSQRDQELDPGDMAKHVQGAVIGEPAQDW